MSENSLTLLGTASGMPNPDRNGSGYLLETGESLSLIDAGPGVAAAFRRNGFDHRQLDRIFITHTHADHVADLPTFIQMLHGLSVRRHVDVFVPADFVDPLWRYLAALYLVKERLRFDLEIHGYREGVVYDDIFRLEAFANSHMTGHADEFHGYGYANDMLCYSYLLQVGERRILHSADIGHLDDIRDRLVDLDIALIEAKHIDINELLALAPKTTVKRYILTHLDDRLAVAELAAKIESARVWNVEIADDGKWIEL
ncbi:MBL fold metallo-hydrolase [candidate division GN15 bacterium]|nr:MBL fold metallo-hydrolase [candidate division GN15 bacterium]